MTRPSQVQIQVAITLLFAVALTAGLAITKPPSPLACQRLVIASSNEKFGMLRDFAASYSRSEGRASQPCVTVAVEQVNSGDAEVALEQGWAGMSVERPDVWAPASTAWLNLLIQSTNEGALRPAGPAHSLFKSPLVIGIPQPMAEALGYPAKPVGWSDILALVKNPAGWREFGHAEWGAFRFGKTNPTVSTSGLHALVGTYLAATGGSLTKEQVTSPSVHDFVAGVEAGVVHYAQTAADFLSKLRDASDRGQLAALLYVSAVAVEEQELVDYNAGVIAGVHHGAPSVFLVPIYPKEGTPVADHPYVILNSAKQVAAQGFYGYLTRTEQQAEVDKRGFRAVGSGDRGEVGRLLGQQKFIKSDQPAVVLQLPPGDVLGAMVSAWKVYRKRARVLILVDAAADSGLLKQAMLLLADAVARFNPTDSAGVWVFPAPAGYPTPYVVQVPVAPVSSELATALRAITHTGDRPDLESSLKAAIVSMGASYDPGAVDAVLLVEMSPGQRTANALEIEQYLRNQVIGHFVRVFTVGPASERLQDLATNGGGLAYQPGSANHFLSDVISNF